MKGIVSYVPGTVLFTVLFATGDGFRMSNGTISGSFKEFGYGTTLLVGVIGFSIGARHINVNLYRWVMTYIASLQDFTMIYRSSYPHTPYIYIYIDLIIM